MQNALETWPRRLLATVTALALVAAYVLGAYAHAAGHQQPRTAHASGAAVSGIHAGHHAFAAKATAAAPRHLGGAHDVDGNGHSAPDGCYDIICNGGQAILVPAPVLPHPALYVPPVQAAAAFVGTRPGGLERPPRTFLPA